MYFNRNILSEWYSQGSVEVNYPFVFGEIRSVYFALHLVHKQKYSLA